MRQLPFITSRRFLLCDGSLHSSCGFRDLRTIEQIVRTFRNAPKGGQSTEYLYHETLHQPFYLQMSVPFSFSTSSFPFAFTCALMGDDRRINMIFKK